jgi:glycosyltransferase involved in cell wall biosynthesis
MMVCFRLFAGLTSFSSARYMAACDVLVMPWNKSEWVRACNPVKLKEYLAVGRPVVSTDFHELSSYDGLVSVAATAEEFARAIRAGLERPADPGAGRERVRHETWRAKALELLARLRDSGLVPASRASTPMR